MIFNGSFIYYNKAKEAIVKLDLATKDERCLVIPRGKQKRQVSLFSFISLDCSPHPGDNQQGMQAGAGQAKTR